MSQFHTIAENSYFIEDVRTTCNRSSNLDSSLVDDEVNKVDRLPFLYHSIHLVKIQMETNSTVISPIQEKYITKQMETNQGAVHWINLARAQDKGLQFWQTRSHAIIVCISVPADCIFKVITQKGEQTLFERLSTPRPAPKIVLKSHWQLQQLQQPNTLDSSTSAGIGKPLRGLHLSTSTVVWKPLRKGFEPIDEKEEPEFEVDLRIEGIAQNAILKDEERIGKTEVVDKLKVVYQPKRESNRFHDEGRAKMYEQGKIEIALIGTNFHSCPVKFLLEASTRRIDLL